MKLGTQEDCPHAVAWNRYQVPVPLIFAVGKSQGKASAVETLKENGKTLKENLKNSKEKGALSIVHRVLTIKKKIMQRIYFIDEMTPLLEHSYTDKNGQPQVFAVQGFVLSDGCNTLYGETQGNYAKAALALKLTVGQCVAVQTTSSARSYTTKDGEQRWENRVTITNIAPFGPRRKAEGGQTS